MRIFALAIILFSAFIFQNVMAQCPALVKDAQISLQDKPVSDFALWVRTIADVDEFTAGIQSQNGDGFVLAGVSKGADEGAFSILLMEIDKRGSVLWRTRQKVGNFESMGGIYKNGDSGYVLALNTLAQNSDILPELLFVDLNGDILKREKLDDGKVLQLVALQDGGWMAMQDVKAKTDGIVFKQLDDSAGVIHKRRYLSGTPHQVNDTSQMPDGSVMAAGWIKLNTGSDKANGWIVALEKDGSLIWQRSYGLGRFSAVVPLGFRYAVVLGYDNNDFINIMAIKRDNGDIAWRRKVISANKSLKLSNVSLGVDMSSGGVINVLISSSHKSSGKINARVLSFSPRGDGLEQKSYYYGKSSNPRAMIKSKDNKQIVLGSAVIKHGSHNESKNGWILELPAVQKWSNPCSQKRR